ncbi:metallophosphoesterase family protein [Enterovirga rhinocerotis]|uniref:metallophosphoesterase family protein n=1 Tax=Enterovirga rhinocerotis TaxID=1339210 RepID=UPI001AAD5E1A|nr:metallophosphoesterase [Enterovirga rhinocerotis]
MVSFRFLHAADIHLDSPLHGLSRYNGLAVDEVRARPAPRWTTSCHAIDERLDFVLIAGDLFDGDWRDMGTGLHFARAVSTRRASPSSCSPATTTPTPSCRGASRGPAASRASARGARRRTPSPTWW